MAIPSPFSEIILINLSLPLLPGMNTLCLLTPFGPIRVNERLGMKSHLGCRFRFVHTALIAPLVIAMICFGMTQQSFAEVDARRELAKVQAEYARYIQEEQDFYY
jgi:hypothetical protein